MTKTYVIVSNGRSRSTLLRYNLTSIGVAGTPQQLGLRNVDLTEKGFLEFLETCRVENVQGFSVKFGELLFIYPYLGKMDCKYIWLRRQNKIRQAISDLKAQKTGKSNARELVSDPPTILSDKDINYLKTHIQFYTLYEIYSGDFFSEKGIIPFELYYKDLDTYEKRSKKVVEILNFLGIKEIPKPITDTLVSQHTAWNDEIYRLYKEHLYKTIL